MTLELPGQQAYHWAALVSIPRKKRKCQFWRSLILIRKENHNKCFPPFLVIWSTDTRVAILKCYLQQEENTLSDIGDSITFRIDYAPSRLQSKPSFYHIYFRHSLTCQYLVVYASLILDQHLEWESWFSSTQMQNAQTVNLFPDEQFFQIFYYLTISCTVYILDTKSSSEVLIEAQFNSNANCWNCETLPRWAT